MGKGSQNNNAKLVIRFVYAAQPTGASLVKVKWAFTRKSEVCFANENQAFHWGDKNVKLRPARVKDEKKNKSMSLNKEMFKVKSSKKLNFQFLNNYSFLHNYLNNFHVHEFLSYYNDGTIFRNKIGTRIFLGN